MLQMEINSRNALKTSDFSYAMGYYHSHVMTAKTELLEAFK